MVCKQQELTKTESKIEHNNIILLFTVLYIELYDTILSSYYHTHVRTDNNRSHDQQNKEQQEQQK